MLDLSENLSGAVEDFASFEKAIKDEKIDRLSAATDYVQSSHHTELVKRHLKIIKYCSTV